MERRRTSRLLLLLMMMMLDFYHTAPNYKMGAI
jgi:hypothetical protein